MRNNLNNCYKIGVYGTRNVCTQVVEQGYAITSFVSDMSTGYSGNMGFKIPRNWNIEQFPTVTRLDSPSTSKTLFDKLQELFNYATSYANETNKTLNTRDKNKLVVEYLRSEKYKSGLWPIIAGDVDNDFVNYVFDRANSDIYPKNIYIPKENFGNMGIEHLAATLDALLYNFIIFDNEANDLAGWAGDLLQLGGVIGDKIGNKTWTENDIYNLIGGTDDELANTLLGTEDQPMTAEKAGFGFEDLELDIDAIGLFEGVNNGVPIYTAFDNYYNTSEYSDRIQTFLVSVIGSYTSKADAQAKLTELAKRYTLLKTLTSRLFVENKGYKRDEHGNVLAEQFSKKITDLL